MGKQLSLILAGLTLTALAVAQGLIASTEIPVTVELAPVVDVGPQPALLDFGRIGLDHPGIHTMVHVSGSNVATSVWAYVVDEPGGWELGPEHGPDTYSVDINQVMMTAEPQRVLPSLDSYYEGVLSVLYMQPTGDTYGAGVQHPFVLRIEARQLENE